MTSMVTANGCGEVRNNMQCLNKGGGGHYKPVCDTCEYTGWISVEERLPSDDKRVLATDGVKHEVVCCVNSGREWVGATSEYGYLMILKKVTHWTPLPPLDSIKENK